MDMKIFPVPRTGATPRKTKVKCIDCFVVEDGKITVVQKSIFPGSVLLTKTEQKTMFVIRTNLMQARSSKLSALCIRTQEAPTACISPLRGNTRAPILLHNLEINVWDSR